VDLLSFLFNENGFLMGRVVHVTFPLSVFPSLRLFPLFISFLSPFSLLSLTLRLMAYTPVPISLRATMQRSPFLIYQTRTSQRNGDHLGQTQRNFLFPLLLLLLLLLLPFQPPPLSVFHFLLLHHGLIISVCLAVIIGFNGGPSAMPAPPAPPSDRPCP